MVLQTVQRPGLCNVVYSSVHYKEPLQSFDRAYFCRDIAMIVQKAT